MSSQGQIKIRAVPPDPRDVMFAWVMTTRLSSILFGALYYCMTMDVFIYPWVDCREVGTKGRPKVRKKVLPLGLPAVDKREDCCVQEWLLDLRVNDIDRMLTRLL
jgi:hypothetical protein